MSAPPRFDKKQLQNLIAEGKLKEALERMSAIAPDDIRNEIVLLQGRLSKLEKDERLGILSYDDANRTRNQLNNAALELINRLDGDDDDDDDHLPLLTSVSAEILLQVRTHITHARIAEALQQLLDSQKDTKIQQTIAKLQNTYNEANALGGTWHQASRPNIVKPILDVIAQIESGSRSANKK